MAMRALARSPSSVVALIAIIAAVASATAWEAVSVAASPSSSQRQSSIRSVRARILGSSARMAASGWVGDRVEVACDMGWNQWDG